MHDPYDFPNVAGRGFTVDHGEEIFIGLAATLTDSTSRVKKMSFNRRKCVVAGEPMSDYTPDGVAVYNNYSRYVALSVKIAHSIFYKQHFFRGGCLLECRARLLQEKCKCLPYYYPDFGSVWNASAICNLKGLSCLARKSGIFSSILKAWLRLT